jgi:flagellin
MLSRGKFKFPSLQKRNAMSLGVLNNLSALYAENSLNSTQASLSTVLQQLSSGSKINSGADDAAGLSLVDGLAANSAALTQSSTNAQEGVGLLTVADGALSQVTNLLNRAVTLATEVSNGTLNDSQESAANKEYQSILSEIDNIGSTTTYNQKAVFGSNTNIYTGDSSATGASIDSLNIGSLSSANVGDTNGAMSYSTSQTSSDVFIDLGDTSTGATTSLGAAAGKLTLETLNSAGATVTSTLTIAAGATANDLINQINSAGLGVTASFTDGAVAGAPAGKAADYGIMISGSVGAGGAPAAASYSGTLTTTNVQDTDTLSGSITFKVGNGASQTVTMAQVAAASSDGKSTVTDLSTYITAATGLGVTVADNGGTLTLTGSNNEALTVTSNLTDANTGTAYGYQSTAAYAVGVDTTSGAFELNGADATSDIVAGSAGSSSGTATISYTDEAGQSLSGSDLSTQGDAQKALTDLNAAISDVAAQDGYLGAQINTLNSISSVLSTQQENVVSAQNAVQATDYSAATSAMSKYEILSQTGIAALAQANSQAQEVTKLLQ